MIKSALQSSLTNDIKYRSMSAGAVPSSEYLIRTYEVGATPLASITFDDLAQYAGVYQHLQIRAVTRTTQGTTLRMNRIRFNGDTASNYSTHQILGDSNAGSPYAGSAANSDGMVTFYGTGASSVSGAFGAGVIDILDPFETTKNTTLRSFGGQHSYSIVNLASGSWRNLNSLTSITVYPENSDSYTIGSRFSLYGVTA